MRETAGLPESSCNLRGPAGFFGITSACLYRCKLGVNNPKGATSGVVSSQIGLYGRGNIRDEVIELPGRRHVWVDFAGTVNGSKGQASILRP